MSARDQLIKDVKAFLRIASSPAQKDRMTATRLGKRVTGNPNLIPRLLGGRDINLTTYDKLIREMEIWYERNGYYEE